MTGLVRKATLLCVGGVLLASAAMAGVPNAGNSVLRNVSLCPRAGSAVDPLTLPHSVLSSCITVHDANNNPVSGSTVVLDFAPCYPAATDITLCSLQGQAGMTTVCGGGGRSVSIAADPSGNACFSVVGNSNNATGSTAISAPCIKVYADSQLLGTIGYNAYDQEGSNGTDGTDLFLFFQDQGFAGAAGCTPQPGCGPPTTRPRSDYDDNGTVDGTDLFLFFLVQGGAYAANSCSPNGNCIP